VLVPEKYPFCSILIANFNGKHHLTDCLTSLMKLKYPKDKIEIIIIDNGSTDSSVEFVKNNFPKATILQLNKNYGFAESNNKGIKIAKGDFIIILDNDTKVDEKWLIELVKVALSDKKIGICGSKVLDFNNPQIIQYSGGYLDILGSPYHRGLGELDKKKYDKIEEVFYAFGCSMLIKKEILSQLEYFFDPSYFAYFEETDLCWRIKYLGYKVVYVPTSIVLHKSGATSKKMGDLMILYLYRNKIWTFKKNLRMPLKQIILLFVSVRVVFAILYRILTKKWKYGIYVFKFLFTNKKSDVDLKKISLKKQLATLSLPILSKYSQYFFIEKIRIE